MEKKSAKKKTSRKSSEKTRQSSSGKIENKVLQNLIELQKVHINLAEKFENLTNQISNLLALFEMTARALGKQQGMQITERDKDLCNKFISNNTPYASKHIPKNQQRPK